ncbi:glycosyltransferase family 4 protein [Thermithiobacillus plumbiphilus]|uniref:Glycosyltransferase family 4 protein n=1 Tax=Thermithiobacillus plumbiphilus TaxID=1729899 RepID=A0ABU9D607_9PROT
MKIAFVVPHLMSGGVETFVLRLGDYFVKQGCSVDLLATEKEGDWFNLAISRGMVVKCLPVEKSFAPVIHAIRVGRWLRSGAYDAIILNHAKYAQAAIQLLPSNTVVVPVIHNDDKEVYRVACANRQACNFLVGVSRRVCKAVKAHFPETPIYEIWHGVEAPKTNSRLKRLEGEPLKLIYVGRVQHHQKGVFYLVDIVKGCIKEGIKVELTVVGEGGDLEALQSRVRESGLESIVKLVGSRSYEAVLRCLSRHHVLLMPSHYEGFGLVAIEAQAAGCVPVANYIADVTDVTIAHGISGFLVEDNEINQYVSLIKELYDDTDQWLKMSSAAMSRVEGLFSIEKMGEAYLDLLEAERECTYVRNKRLALEWQLLGWRAFVPQFLRSAREYLTMAQKKLFRIKP